MSIVETYYQNLHRNLHAIAIANGIQGMVITPIETEVFASHVRTLISYYCRHPRRIVEAIEIDRANGLQVLIGDLHRLTEGEAKVWHGTIGEVLATAFVSHHMNYEFPVLKLRLVPNRRMAMHGDVEWTL